MTESKMRFGLAIRGQYHLQDDIRLRFDEIVRVHLLLAVASRATFQMGYLLEVDGQARATAVTVHGCVDPTGRPVRMPSWLSEMAQTTG